MHDEQPAVSPTAPFTTVVACGLMDDTFTFVPPGETLAATVEKLWLQNFECLRVVDTPTNCRLGGWISKRDVFVELPGGFGLRNIAITKFTAALAG